MSNQTQAHVTDERAAFEAWSSGPEKRCTDQQLKKNANGEYSDGYTSLDWMAWQAARADLRSSIAAGAPAETTAKPPSGSAICQAYRKRVENAARVAGIDGQWDPFMGAFRTWMDSTKMFLGDRWTPTQEQIEAVKVAPAETMADDRLSQLLAERRRAIVRCDAEAQKEVESKIVMHVVVKGAAQPAPAPATDARDARDAARYHWLRDPSGQKAAWQLEAMDKQIDAAMLSANSPREAG